jgi:hypothetical protein
MIHVQGLVACAFEALVIGNRAAIRSVGKHRRRGFGDIHHWEIEPAEFESRCTCVLDGMLMREIPVRAASAIAIDPALMPPAVHIGWTPPYWLPANRADGWRAGTAAR